MSGQVSISTFGLFKSFGDFTAVNDLTLNIHKGEIYGFLGLNGAGKTTTIRMLLGMIRPSAGKVSLFGTEVKSGWQQIWGQVGYLVETPHAYPDLTVLENLEIVRRLRHLTDAGAVQHVIEELGLTQYAKRSARTLSLGNAQRLGLAKALIHHPDLLILDEPANGLDPAGIVEVRNLLRGLAENRGVTIFISSHILSEIARLATRIGVIHQGKLVKELQTSELSKEEGQHLRVEVRDRKGAREALAKAGVEATPDGDNAIIITDESLVQHPDEVATLLVLAGYPPTMLMAEHKDLESYFLELVGMKETDK